MTSVEKEVGTDDENEPGHDHASSGDSHAEGDADHDHEHGGPFGDKSEIVFSLACGTLTAVGWGLSKISVPTSIVTACFVFAYVLGAWFPVQEVQEAVRKKKFDIELLMILAATGAAILGEWFEGALLLFLFTLGHALEGYAMGRARRAISALSELVPDDAIRLSESGEETVVLISELALGDRVLVKPNTRMPADGFVVAGTSSVDQAPITGESMPVDKRPVADPGVAAARPDAVSSESRIFAGSINGPAALTVQVTKVAGESTLARVATLVAAAETRRSPTQELTDRFERIFVPAILAIDFVLLFAWVVLDEPASASFYRAMAVLVAASPCALAIATPSAVLSGVARAARAGVLIKGGAHLETLGRVRAVAFDKTGTLTEGRPRLTDVVPLGGADETALLRIVVAVERQSDHPLAAAIVTEGNERLGPGASVPEATDVEAVIGHGVRGIVEGAAITIGKPGMFGEAEELPPELRSAIDSLRGSGRTVMVVRSNTDYLGVLGTMDTARPEARAVVARLHALGVTETVMLTGDHDQVGRAVADEVGIRSVRADLLPEQKVDAIADLVTTWRHVAMIGDGVNDAPAMARSSVGVAMGAGGSDVALETADVALMADHLDALPFAMELSRAARRIIRQNLWASLGMVAFLVPATMSGFAGIGLAVTLHEGSTLLVVANALRLLAYADDRAS